MAVKRKSPRASTQIKASPKKKAKIEEPKPKTPVEEDLEKLNGYFQTFHQRKYPVAGPVETLRMFESAAIFAFDVVTEDRHRWQQSLVDCIGEAIEDIRTRIYSDMETMRTQSAEADTTREDLVRAKDSASAVLENKKTIMEQKKNILTEKKTVVTETQEILREKTDELDDKQQDQIKYEAAEKILRADKEMHLPYITECEDEPDKEDKQRVMEALKIYECDESMIGGAEVALDIPKVKRGKYDHSFFKAMEEFLGEQLSELVSKIQHCKIDNASAVAAKEHAEVAYEKAIEERVFATEDVQQATKEKTEAASYLKQCEKKIASHDRDIKLLATQIEKQEGTKTDIEICVQLFEALNKRTNHTAEVPEPEEEKAATVEVADNSLEEIHESSGVTEAEDLESTQDVQPAPVWQQSPQ